MPDLVYLLIGAIAGVAASIALYTACIRLRAGRKAWFVFSVIAILFVVTVVAFDSWLGIAESVYAALLVMMVVLTALPFALALKRDSKPR